MWIHIRALYPPTWKVAEPSLGPYRLQLADERHIDRPSRSKV